MHVETTKNEYYYINMKIFILGVFIMLTRGAFAADADVATPESDAEIHEIANEINDPGKIPPHAQQSDEPLITVNTDGLLDMSAKTALDLSGGLPPDEQIVLPFLPNFPINNLEIKLRVLDLRF